MTPTKRPPINIKATAWTIGVHVLLFLLFFFLKYSLPAAQPVEELGMEVNLGTSEDGSGDDQPMAVDAPAEANVAANYKPASQVANEAKEIMKSDDPDAPAVAPVKTVTEPVRHTTQPDNNTRSRNTQRENANTNTPQPTPQKPKYVYSGSKGPGGNNAVTNSPGTSEGNTKGNGDRGVPGGTPGASNYTGSPGNGTGGISHTLSGRDISPKQFVAEFNEGGKVVIRITVDRDGDIVAKSVKSSPSATLSKLALQKLSQAKFTANKDAAPQQFGEITIVFKTRK